MEFVWNDGGRAACGFVGSTGDCVTRAIAIATGKVYRDVYDSLSDLSEQTARHGVYQDEIDAYLRREGWSQAKARMIDPDAIPSGVLILQFDPSSQSRKRTRHLACVIDHTLHDTWNPFEDSEYVVESYWIHPAANPSSTSPIVAPGTSSSSQEEKRNRQEYEKILARVSALHRTASNEASTEGEIRTALRMLQTLMLKHNLSRSDITDDDNVDRIGMTRRACPLNRNRACQWESALAFYIVEEIFPTVQFYQGRNGHRTFFWFYGPHDDVDQAIGLFREMLLTIATSAQVRYRGFTRGSGASYAEGYVNGLPKSYQSDADDESPMSEGAIIHARTLAVHAAADQWLEAECGIRLCKSSGTSRRHFDASAHSAGKRDGAKHSQSSPYSRRRITG